MRAIVAGHYGPPERLQLEDVPRPTVRDDEVLLKAHAASANPGDWHLVTGDPYLIRVLGYGLRRPKQRVPGQDVAGVVEAVGKAVTRWKPGDEVFGYGTATFAEYASVPEDQLQRRPPHLSLEQAATVPVAGLTALHALRDQARLTAGQRLLVIGAGGGVGQFTVQLAKAFGAEVTGVCSTRNLERVRSIGAHHVIDYTAEDFPRGKPRFDAIVRLAGHNSVRQCRRALAARGTLVIVGGGRYGRWLGGMERFLGTKILNVFTRQQLRPFLSICNPEDLAALTSLLEEHRIEPLLDRRFPLEQAPAALAYVGKGHAQGKVVISV